MLRAFRQDGSINVVVESPRGSAMKFKYDPDDDVMILSRPLPAGLVYPHDSGFVPVDARTRRRSRFDAVILWDGASYPGVAILAPRHWSPRGGADQPRVEETRAERSTGDAADQGAADRRTSPPCSICRRAASGRS